LRRACTGRVPGPCSPREVMIERQPILVSGGFDDIRSQHLRFLEEAARLGDLHVLLWPDETLEQIHGEPPKFPLEERRYFLNAVRYVARVIPLVSMTDADALPHLHGVQPRMWVDLEGEANQRRRRYCQQHDIEYRVLPASQIRGFPEPPPMPSPPGRKKVVVTGCYDWFHTGHVRFTEEVSTYGDLYVVIGHDANIRLLKGEGHPLLSENERRYVVGSIKYVKQALISSGEGWLDADPEIRRLKPDIYAVNEDGDKGGKREYCQRLGIEYLVLKRTPAPGLPPRSSTDLRGF
ncbi:MAG: adenylyltransferase/cytidyltransferase family protein, partial [Planctomycetes bacterium]|nr:adenylyltransferase/cytidyltransferase family protein [Planctomycetota bacterium]